MTEAAEKANQVNELGFAEGLSFESDLEPLPSHLRVGTPAPTTEESKNMQAMMVQMAQLQNQLAELIAANQTMQNQTVFETPAANSTPILNLSKTTAAAAPTPPPPPPTSLAPPPPPPPPPPPAPIATSTPVKRPAAPVEQKQEPVTPSLTDVLKGLGGQPQKRLRKVPRFTTISYIIFYAFVFADHLEAHQFRIDNFQESR